MQDAAEALVRCHGGDCQRRSICLRHTAAAAPGAQFFAAAPTWNGWDCSAYLEADARPATIPDREPLLLQYFARAHQEPEPPATRPG